MRKEIIAFMFLPIVAFAQTANIKDIPADQEGTTTISISKGDKKAGDEYQITEGTATVAGEAELLTKAARTSWKVACSDWKKELKELNSENKILAMNCNQPTCEKNDTAETVCTSRADYKLKVKVK